MPSPESNFFTGIKFEPKKTIAMPQHRKPSPFVGVFSPERDGLVAFDVDAALAPKALRIGAAFSTLDGTASTAAESRTVPGTAADASDATRARTANERIVGDAVPHCTVRYSAMFLAGEECSVTVNNLTPTFAE